MRCGADGLFFCGWVADQQKEFKPGACIVGAIEFHQAKKGRISIVGFNRGETSTGMRWSLAHLEARAVHN